MTMTSLSRLQLADVARVRAARDDHFAWLHGSHMTLREAFAYQTVLKNDPEGARSVIQRVERRWTREESRDAKFEAEKAVLMRRDQRLASPLFLAFCAHEGLDPDTVADAVLPRSLPLLPGDGHPWLATRALVIDAAVAGLARAKPRGRDHSAPIRHRDDPRGLADAVQNGMTIDIHAAIGRAMVVTHQGKGMLALPDEVPRTLLVAAVDRRLDEIVDHPVLRGEYRIIAAEAPGPGRTKTTFSFNCPGVPFRRTVSTPPPGTPLLFTDAALSGADAVDDMLARMVAAILAVGAFPTAHVLLREARIRVRRINLARPRQPCLPAPGPAQVAAAIRDGRTAMTGASGQ